MSIAHTRSMSKALLGSQYRAEIAAAIDEAKGPVSAQGLADETNIRYPRVQQELKHLLHAGVLTERPPEGRTVFYEKIDTAYWSYCTALTAEWNGTGKRPSRAISTRRRAGAPRRPAP